MSAIRRLFWNDDERRVRALWRLLLQVVASGLVALVVGLILMPLAAALPIEGGDGAGSSHALIGSILAAIAVGAGVWLVGRGLDKRTFEDFGFHLDKLWIADLVAGIALGGLLMGGIFVVELAAGWITIEGTFAGAPEGGSIAVALVIPMVVFLCVGFYEELFSRGYQLRNLAEGLHGQRVSPQLALALATVLSASVFGLLHANNPSATPLSTINVALAGCLLAVGPLLTSELGFAMGLHMSWNYFQGNVFGFPVSGTDAGPRVFAVTQGGSPLITGGEFGPEAGLIGIAAMLVGAIATVGWVRLTRGEVTLATRLVEPPIDHLPLRAAELRANAIVEAPTDDTDLPVFEPPRPIDDDDDDDGDDDQGRYDY